MTLERFVGTKILVAESTPISQFLKEEGKEKYGVNFIADWIPFEEPGLAQYMLAQNIIAGVIHPYLMNESTLIEAHKDGAKILVLHSQAVDLERSQMFSRLLSQGLNMVNRNSTRLES
jgi:hypothetical protein